MTDPSPRRRSGARPTTRNARLPLVLALGLVLALPAPGRAQVGTAALGAAGGLVSGVIVTVGWVVEQATIEQQYLHSARDLLSFTGTPLVFYPAAGATMGYVEPELLADAGIGAGIGVVAGAALGVGLGQLLAGDQTGRWAGGLMGAAGGLIAGALVATLSYDWGETGPDDPAAARIPLGLEVRF